MGEGKVEGLEEDEVDADGGGGGEDVVDADGGVWI